MPSEKPAADTLTALRDLRIWAEEIGYIEFISSFSNEPPAKMVLAFLESEASPRLALAVKFLFLGHSLTDLDCQSVFGVSLLSKLVDIGIVQIDMSGRFNTGGIRLQFALGVTFFVGVPDVRFPFYFGDDSLGLLRRHRVYRGQKALDFCTGTGVQALHHARNGAQTIGVDINPLAIKLASLNAILNEVDRSVSFRQGDLWEAIRDGEVFDWISANPPLVPTIGGGSYPLVGDGGRDGMALVWRMIDGLRPHLSPHGSMLVLGETWSDGILPICHDRLQDLSSSLNLAFRMTILRTFSIGKGDYWHEAMAHTYKAHGGLDYDVASDGLLALAEELGARGIVTYFLQVRHGSGVEVVDFSPLQSDRLWDV